MVSLYHYELNPTYKNVVATQLKILQPKHYEARDSVYETPQRKGSALQHYSQPQTLSSGQYETWICDSAS